MKRSCFTIAFFLMFIIISCKKNNDKHEKLSYDIQINYSSIPALDKRVTNNDTLLILFDGNFNKDTVSITLNNKHFKDVVLTTDEVTGVADDIETMQYMHIKNIGIRINSGKLIYIEPGSRHNNLRLTYIDSVAIVKFYNKLPASY